MFNALEFVNDGVFINPSCANPSLVRAVPTTKANGDIPSEFDRKLVLANGPAATTGNAVFVSTIFVKDVKLKESVEVKGMPTHLHRRLAGGMFEVETELKTGFLGATFPKFPSIIVSRDQECALFTTRHKDKKSAQRKSIASLSPGAERDTSPQSHPLSLLLRRDTFSWPALSPSRRRPWLLTQCSRILYLGMPKVCSLMIMQIATDYLRLSSCLRLHTSGQALRFLCDRLVNSNGLSEVHVKP